MGELADTLGKFVSPVEKVIESITGAIGKAYEPRHMRKMADAEAYRLKTIGEAMRENCDIPIVVNSEGTSLSTADFDEFVNRTKSRMAFQELKKQENIEAVADKAVSLLEGEEAVTAEPVEQDWMLRFFNSVEDVSNEQMQEIWAKILAGEVKRPGTYSLRTLAALHNMTQQEALAFQRLCTHCLYKGDSYFILNDNQYQEQYNISYGTIMKLAECGLINSGSLLQLTLTLEPGTELVAMTDDYIIITEIPDKAKKVVLQVFPLTESGTELSKVVGCHMPLHEFRAITQIIQKEAHLGIVKVHRIENRRDGIVSYNRTQNLLEE